MSTPITLTIPHQLGRLGARRRIDDGFARFVQQVPGSDGAGAQQWEGDRLNFSLGALGQKVSGMIDVQDTEVRMQIDLPGMFGLLASGLKGKLRKAGQQLLLTKK